MSASPLALSPYTSTFVDQCSGIVLAPTSHHASPKSIALQQTGFMLACIVLNTSYWLGANLTTSLTCLPNVSPPTLNLVIDLLHFDLQQVLDSGAPASPPLAPH
jgi:hypothetical protein